MSNKLFTTVPVPKFPSSTFSLSRSVIFNPRFMKLYAPNVIETLPGDGINERSEQFARTQPMVAPTFAKINADQFAFFVPCWQIHEHFDEFITGGDKGDYQEKMPYVTVGQLYEYIYSYLEGLVDSPVPYYQYNECLELIQCVIEHCDLIRAVPFTLPDFILSTLATDQEVRQSNLNAFESLNSNLADCELRVNLLPFAAYLKVWCEYFRDENLVEDYYQVVWKDSGLYSVMGGITITDYISLPDFQDQDEVTEMLTKFTALFGVLPRAWKKDYFTAALPFTQKGPEVLIPLAGTFPVEFHGATSPAANVRTVSFKGEGTGLQQPGNLVTASSLQNYDPITASVELGSSGLGATIQELRRAFKLEEFYEADARGGNRYPENTLMQFGVRTPDSRLPRAIFLGSNNSPVTISEVVQTSSTSDQPTPQGTLAGKGISYGNNRLSAYYYTMHGFLLNLYALRVNALYETGIHPMFSRFDRTEYAWPRFAHLGEQPVYTKELFVSDEVGENEVFGYEPRYSEYKSEKSSVHHLMKGSLNFWTMSRRFGDKPVLNQEFIYNPPRLDNFAVVNPLQSPFIVEIDYRVRANRKLPFFGVPML